MKLPSVRFRIENRWKWVVCQCTSIVWLGTELQIGNDYNFNPNAVSITLTIANFNFILRIYGEKP